VRIIFYEKILIHYNYNKSSNFDGFQEYAYTNPNHGHYSGVALYNVETEELIIAHRGSVTKVDWLITDLAIASVHEKSASDVAALDFADMVLQELSNVLDNF